MDKDNNSTKVGDVKLISFISISNILILSEVGFYNFFLNFKHTSWIALIFYIIITFLLSMLFKGFPKDSMIVKKVQDNKIIKFLILLFYTIIIATMIFLTTVIIKDKYYADINIIILYSSLLFTCIFIGFRTFNNIINISMIFFFFILLFYIISFSHLDGRNMNLLLPFTLDLKKLLSAVLILIFPLENILFSLNCNNLKNGFTRKAYVLGNVFSLVYLLIIFIDSITLLGADYYVNVKYGSFIRWEVYQGNKFIENFDVFLLIIIIITITFRLGLDICNFRNLLKVRKTEKFNIIFFAIFFVLIGIYCIFINHFQIILKYLLYGSLGLSFIIYIYFVGMSWKLDKEGTNGKRN